MAFHRPGDFFYASPAWDCQWKRFHNIRNTPQRRCPFLWCLRSHRRGIECNVRQPLQAMQMPSSMAHKSTHYPFAWAHVWSYAFGVVMFYCIAFGMLDIRAISQLEMNVCWKYARPAYFYPQMFYHMNYIWWCVWCDAFDCAAVAEIWMKSFYHISHKNAQIRVRVKTSHDYKRIPHFEMTAHKWCRPLRRSNFCIRETCNV